MADRKETDMSKASDTAYIRGLDTNGNSILINKDDLVDSIFDLIKGKIKLGGRNYIILSMLSSYTPYNTIPTYSGNTITTKLVKPSSAGLNFTISVSEYKTVGGETYTISGTMKKNGNPVTNAMWIEQAATTYNYPISFNVDDSTGRFVITTKYSESHVWIIHTRIQGEVGDIITLDELKFEKGNIATDWTPAVEEMINS